MKIARVVFQGRTVPALVDEENRRVTLLKGGLASHANPVLAIVERRLSAEDLRKHHGEVVGFDQVTFLSPFSALLRNVFAVGKNYREHAAEFDKSGFNATQGASSPIPTKPQIFTKATTSLAGPDDDIVFSSALTTSVDYEGEIGVVIGEECWNVSAAAAPGKVYGYVALNDVTARDLQKSHAQWFLGKSLDGFCPMGPWIATADEVDAPSLRVRTWVNGELRQDGALSDLIFDVPTLIETLSAAMTLLPGDVIATGTPVGVGIGFEPPKFLRDGDLVRIAVTQLGELNNTVREL